MAELPMQPATDFDGKPLNTTGRPHLSASAIERFLGCSWQYYLEKIEKVKAPRAAEFVTGNAAHYAAEVSGRKFLETGEHLDEAALVETFSDYFVREWKKAALTPRMLAEFGDEPTAREKLYKQGLQCVIAWRNVVAPTLTGLKEVEWSGRVPLSGAYDLVYKIDVLTVMDGWIKVADYKFTHSDRERDPDEWLAANIYALAVAQRFGRLPNELELIVIRRMARAARVLDPRPRTTRTKAHIASFLQLADSVADAITNDRFEPFHTDPERAQREAWRCKSCDVRSACAYAL
jgi:hypothetical protein